MMGAFEALAAMLYQTPDIVQWVIGWPICALILTVANHLGWINHEHWDRNTSGIVLVAVLLWPWTLQAVVGGALAIAFGCACALFGRLILDAYHRN